MLKIGILTFSRVANFGANLQGFSTYCYLKKQGFSPIFIDWEPEDFRKSQLDAYKTTQGKAHFDFFDQYCLKTKQCLNEDDIVKVIEEENIQGIIVGSDAVLQHHPLLTRIIFPTKKILCIPKISSTRMFPNPFWGTFYPKLKRKIPLVIFSASSQNSAYTFFSRKTKRDMWNYLKSFKYISTRDNWTKEMIKNISHNTINPTITPDPVFAFNYNATEYIPTRQEIITKYNLPEKYLLISFLRNNIVSLEWLNQLKEEAQKNNIQCIALPMPNGITFDHNFEYEIPTPLSPLDWYALIKYSYGYIGQNMHPIVVALHNGVPIFSFDSYGTTKLLRTVSINQSSKIYHILKHFHNENSRVAINTRFYKIPSAKSVLEKIQTFDTISEKETDSQLLEEYKLSMHQICDIFQHYN